MIHQLATRYRKGTAYFLMIVFYLQLALPSVARVFEPERRLPLRPAAVQRLSLPSANMNFSAVKDFPAADLPEADAGIVEKESPEEAPEIGGPGQPEMSSFKSVNSSDMVDLFTGDFSYNIPLMDVGGYPVNIHYNSGVSMDQEASWVGLGWNLNPGTVSRSTRGMPDDFNGTDTLTRTQSIKPNQTVGVRISGDLELIGLPRGLSATVGVFKNTYSGWGLETGINASINSGKPTSGQLSGSLGISNNTQSGLDISPSLEVHLRAKTAGENTRSTVLGMSTNYNTRAGISALRLSAETRTVTSKYNQHDNAIRDVVTASTTYPGGVISFVMPSYSPTITMPLTNRQFTFRGKVGLEEWVKHPSAVAVEGYVSRQEIAPEDTTQSIPAVGYLYYSKANGRSDVLMDFNREKELVYNNKTTPHIAIPQYTYDVFSISGEGTGGMFRAYRGDVGYMRDYNIRSRSKSSRFSIDLGFGKYFHGGVDFSFTNAYTENSSWSRSNNMNQHIGFRENDTTYQAVYFRNPGEMTSNARSYYQSVGDDAVMRVKLQGQGEAIGAANAFEIVQNGRRTADLPVTSALVKKQRDKRSQVISYLTAEEASVLGLQRGIVSYKENAIPLGACADSFTLIPRVDGRVRKGHHLSQVTVLNGDGRRYIYGIPAYNVEQKDVTFSVNVENDPADLEKGLADYSKGVDNSTANSRGKEGVFTKDIMPAHAHSFLLSGIASPDYVDVKSDGITEDDLGDAVKFNYTRVYGGDSLFAWRTPHQKDKANYNDGLKTYARDEKGTYIYGRKEVWYLNSIESKTMIAVFHVKNDRKDIYSVKDENGGLDTTKKLRRLDKIELYVKADLIKNKTAARPVKTVHFSYSYKLCKGIVSEIDTAIGKLTLDSVWFSYNGNEKGRLNPYIFRYHEGSAVHNPRYNPKYYDRWGNYKNPTTNPGGLDNSDYPYVTQGSASDTAAAAWVMNGITLPSGGKIQVTYEADDYAWVQNRRATQFYTIKGFGSSPANAGNTLYSGHLGKDEHEYVVVESSVSLADTAEIRSRFLQGLDFLYFKLYVQMPAGGYEFVPVYAQVQSFGLVPNSNNRRFWLQLKKVDGKAALARSAIQFLRLNLPSQAFPGSETGDNISVNDAVRMLVSSFSELKNAVAGFHDASKIKGWCRKVDLSRSFVRLNSAEMRKRGGGLRVKRVEVLDNWNQMTNQREARFGQEYSYTTTHRSGSSTLTVSSGVASYEPMIGAEENPFRVPIAYSERIAPLAPANNLFSEEPLGESYFPSASVGYSKVRVRTINAKARSANGWQETEFYTTKDFPTLVEHTLLDDQSRRKYKPVLGNFLRIYAVNHVSISQGFKVELNDMNGKVRAQYSYAENDSLRPISYVLNYYKVDSDRSARPRLNNNVWVVDSLNGHIDKNGQIGKDIEVMLDMRQQTSITLADNRSVNIEIVPAGGWPFFLPSHYHLPQYEEQRFRSAATVKIIQRYGILDSVVAMDKGSIVSTKNLVYDGETGEVVLSRTQNEFNDPVYNFSYPAHWAYSGMGMAYKNIDAVFTNLKLVRGKLYYGGASLTPFPAERFFESGDELVLKGIEWPVVAATGAGCLLFDQPAVLADYGDLVNRAWVMDAGKDIKGKGKGLYLIDSNGRTLTGMVNALRVLRSGKRNLLDASVGSIVSMANPIRETSPGNFYLMADSLTRVINTSAVTYKDQWKVENSYYFKDSCYSVTDTLTEYLGSASGTLLKLKRTALSGFTYEDSKKESSSLLTASYDAADSLGQTIEYRTKGILGFNFSSLPYYNRIQSVINAQLTFAVAGKANTAPGLWKRDTFSYNCGPFGNTCARYNHDWYNDNRAYASSWTSVLKRITAPWNANTAYNGFGVTATNQAVINTVPSDPLNPYDTITCTNLVKDVLENKLPFHGFMFELQNPAQAAGKPHFYNIVFNSPNKALVSPVLAVTYTIRTDFCKQLCLADISDTLVNPYKWGLLGNWRVDRAYTFYHERKESDASTAATDIRKDGELKNFTPFWKFAPAVLTADADTTKWVWNSASSQYNRKGFEIENYDPLGRYNSGLYGYNQTLPVAVAQNSRYREILFDGFEDYGYKTRSCDTCKTPREFDFVKGNANVSTSQAQAHSGRYSIKLLANAEAKITVPIGVAAADTSGILMQVDSSAVTNTIVNGSGTGLNATYEGYSTLSACPIRRHKIPDFDTSLIQGPVDYQWGRFSPFTGMCRNWFTAKWIGYIQAPETDWYTFHARSDGGMTVRVNGVNLTSALNPNIEISGRRIRLERGKIYPIEVYYQHLNGSEAHARLRWSSVLKPQREVVPNNFLYPNTDTSGSVIQNPLYYCYRPANPKQQDMTRTGFSPLQKTKMVVSAWVRMDGADCNTATALQNVVKVTTYGSTETTISLEKTGVRIEGWQRYEAVVTMPHDGTQLKVSIKAPNNRDIYVDDIRAQPFNSHMKSYVYDPENLRLVAELDENNYAAFYEYDDDGTLVRLKKETERGIMTIRETRSALRKD